MELVHKIEGKLATIFKDMPALPKNAKEVIVQYLPYLALIAGVLQLWAAWVLWDIINKYGKVSDFVNSFTAYYGAPSVGLSSFDKLVIYGGVALLVVEAVVLVMAYSPLLKKARRGWDLLFLVSLLQVVYAVVSLFVHGRGAGDLILNLIGAAIGFYFLFQIRDFYKKDVASKAEAK